MAMPFHLSYALFSAHVVTPEHLHFIISSAVDRLGDFSTALRGNEAACDDNNSQQSHRVFLLQL
jgi:hypothetical protein